jgi:hypothetical protein
MLESLKEGLKNNLILMGLLMAQNAYSKRLA